MSQNVTIVELVRSLFMFIWRLLFGMTVATLIYSQVGAVVTIEYHADTGTRNVVDSTGKILANGNEVRIGYFKDGFNPANDGKNIHEVASAWCELHRTTIQVVFDEGGRFYGNQSYSDSEFTDKTICLWILKTSNNDPVFNDFSNVKEYGIFSAKTGWKLPDPEIIPPFNHLLISSSEVEMAYFGSLKPQSLVLAPNSTLKTGGMSFADWRSNVFPLGMETYLKDDMADPDQDGLPNALEYFLGSNPLQKENQRFKYSKQEIGNAPYFTITYQQAKNRTDITAKTISSSDLKNWRTEGFKQEIIAEDEDSKTVQIRIPVGASQQWFQLLLEKKQ